MYDNVWYNIVLYNSMVMWCWRNTVYDMTKLWYGMVWSVGVVWYGVVWYGMVWCGMVWYLKSSNLLPFGLASV